MTDTSNVVPFPTSAAEQASDRTNDEEQAAADAGSESARVLRDDDGNPVPVDPHVTGDGRTFLERVRVTERRPIVPAWARSRAEFRDAARWVAGHYAHAVGYHALRMPLYGGKVVACSPRGLVRALRTVSVWISDGEGEPLRAAATRREDAELYMRLSRQRDARVRARSFLALLALVALVVGVLLVVLTAPRAVMLADVAALVVVFGMLGRRADAPMFGRAVLAPQVTKLTSDVVVRALGALGIAEVNKALGKGGGIAFVSPITREGPGWRADVDLPYGVTVTDIMDRRERLASGLRRPLGCVWPEPAHDAHAGRLVLWVGDQDMSQAKPAPWPLARSGQVDLFKPVPFGVDPRGRAVTILLMFANVLIGAMPGAGKTFALRVLLLACALDPLAELLVFELKGSGDLSVFEPVAHRYASGPDDDTIEQTMTALRDTHKELERRAKTIADLPREVCPENKVTARLAARKSLWLRPKVLAIDECQELFAHPVYGKEAGELATAIIKRGRALGVILLLATQRPDKDSLPTGVSANVGVRLALRVMGQVENDMILGTSAYRNGIRATTFTNRDKGIGYLVGASDDPHIVRSAYIDGPTAERIIARARTLRENAGTLSGHAIGEHTNTTDKPATSLLDDILTVMPASEDRVWSETIIERLAELRPETYAGWKPEQLTSALKPFGIKTGQVWRQTPDGRSANRRGIDRTDIAHAIAERNQNRNAG